LHHFERPAADIRKNTIRVRTVTPGSAASTRATKAGPLAASRTAAVARISNGSARIARATAW
jgi:hypothetical protein